MAGAQDKSRAEAGRSLIAKAVRDEGFRQELTANPNAAVERELGVKLPPGFNVRVVQENPNEVYLVLPHVPSAGAELSRAELSDDDSWWSCPLTCTSCGEYTSLEPGETEGC